MAMDPSTEEMLRKLYEQQNTPPEEVIELPPVEISGTTQMRPFEDRAREERHQQFVDEIQDRPDYDASDIGNSYQSAPFKGWESDSKAVENIEESQPERSPDYGDYSPTTRDMLIALNKRINGEPDQRLAEADTKELDEGANRALADIDTGYARYGGAVQVKAPTTYNPDTIGQGYKPYDPKPTRDWIRESDANVPKVLANQEAARVEKASQEKIDKQKEDEAAKARHDAETPPFNELPGFDEEDGKDFGIIPTPSAKAAAPIDMANLEVKPSNVSIATQEQYSGGEAARASAEKSHGQELEENEVRLQNSQTALYGSSLEANKLVSNIKAKEETVERLERNPKATDEARKAQDAIREFVSKNGPLSFEINKAQAKLNDPKISDTDRNLLSLQIKRLQDDNEAAIWERGIIGKDKGDVKILDNLRALTNNFDKELESAPGKSKEKIAALKSEIKKDKSDLDKIHSDDEILRGRHEAIVSKSRTLKEYLKAESELADAKKKEELDKAHAMRVEAGDRLDAAEARSAARYKYENIMNEPNKTPQLFTGDIGTDVLRGIGLIGLTISSGALKDPSQANAIIDKISNQEVERQRADKNDATSVYNNALRAYGDDLIAASATKDAVMARAQEDFTKAAVNAKDAVVSKQYQQAAAELQIKRAEERAKFEIATGQEATIKAKVPLKSLPQYPQNLDKNSETYIRARKQAKDELPREISGLDRDKFLEDRTRQIIQNAPKKSYVEPEELSSITAYGVSPIARTKTVASAQKIAAAPKKVTGAKITKHDLGLTEVQYKRYQDIRKEISDRYPGDSNSVQRGVALNNSLQAAAREGLLPENMGKGPVLLNPWYPEDYSKGNVHPLVFADGKTHMMTFPRGKPQAEAFKAVREGETVRRRLAKLVQDAPGGRIVPGTEAEKQFKADWSRMINIARDIDGAGANFTENEIKMSKAEFGDLDPGLTRSAYNWILGTGEYQNKSLYQRFNDFYNETKAGIYQVDQMTGEIVHYDELVKRSQGRSGKAPPTIHYGLNKK